MHAMTYGYLAGGADSDALALERVAAAGPAKGSGAADKFARAGGEMAAELLAVRLGLRP